MLDDTVLLRKNLARFQSKVTRVFQLGSRSDVTSSPTQIPLCVVVNIGIACSNACRNARILSIEIIFSLMKSGKLVDFFKRKKNFGVSGILYRPPWSSNNPVSISTCMTEFAAYLVSGTLICLSIRTVQVPLMTCNFRIVCGLRTAYSICTDRTDRHDLSDPLDTCKSKIYSKSH